MHVARSICGNLNCLDKITERAGGPQRLADLARQGIQRADLVLQIRDILVQSVRFETKLNYPGP